jgi:hypothetical protein
MQILMTNRLKKMGESPAWHLMVRGAVKGAEQAGYTLKRQPGRGLSNTYEVTKNGMTKIASVRTTRDRAIAFPPLDKGKRWKTLSNVELVLVSAVDDKDNPQEVDVYLFPADEVRNRFDASYAARTKAGHVVRDDYGMWITLDKGDSAVPSQVGHSLALDYPAIAHFTIDELEAEMGMGASDEDADAPVEPLDLAAPVEVELPTIADVLVFARKKIAALSGLPVEAISLDLKMGL